MAFTFTGPRDGWAITDEGTLLDTSDSGETWGVVNTPVRAVTVCSSSERLWFGGARGDIYLSDNGGPWTLALAGADVPDIHNSLGPNPIPPAPWLACDADTAFALYDYGEAAGSSPYALERTLDGGQQWAAVLGAEVLPTPPDSGVGPSVLDVDATGATTAWILSDCGPCTSGLPALTTTTDGTTFHTTPLPVGSGVYGAPVDVAFSDPEDGYAVVREFPSSHPGSSSAATTVVLATTDGGATWRVVDPNLRG